MTYNVMLGGCDSKHSLEYSRLPSLLETIGDVNPDLFGTQETEINLEKDTKFISSIRNGKAGSYPYEKAMKGINESWLNGIVVANFSRVRPTHSKQIGEVVQAVEMSFPTFDGAELSVCNVYLSHVDEAARLPEIKEVLQELEGQKYGIIMGDLNALSPEDNLNLDLGKFTGRMVEKYTRDGKICYDTVEAVLEAGFVDVGLQHFSPEEMTDMTDLNASTRQHNTPVRIDYIFATPELLPHITEFARVDQGTARIASDHFPWYAVLEDDFVKEVDFTILNI